MRPCAVSFIYPALCRLCSVPHAHDARPPALKHSLKCGIAGSVNFRKCRISARASQRARKREVSSGAFKHSLKFGIYFLIVNVPSFTKRDCPFIPSVTAFSLAPRGVPLIKSEPTVVVEPFSLLTSV